MKLSEFDNRFGSFLESALKETALFISRKWAACNDREDELIDEFRGWFYSSNFPSKIDSKYNEKEIKSYIITYLKYRMSDYCKKLHIYMIKHKNTVLGNSSDSMFGDNDKLDAIEQSTFPEIGRHIESRRLLSKLNLIMNKVLTDRQRKIILLMYGKDNLNGNEVADKLGISSSAVSQHLSKAISRLKSTPEFTEFFQY